MPTIQACRGCLDSKGPLYEASGTHIQQMFEELTTISLKAHIFPVNFCNECISHLRNCHDFRSQCVRADAVLTQLLHSDVGLNQESIELLNRKSLNLQSKLSIRHAHSIDIPPGTDIQTEVKVEIDLKLEDPVKYTEENVLDKIEDSGTKEDSYFDGTEDRYLSYDDEDDVPLIRMVKSDEEMMKKKTKRSKNGFKECYAKEINLTKEEQLAELQARRSSQNYLHAPYKCELCFKGFVEEPAFRNHSAKHDEQAGQYACDVCRLRYPSARQLRGHAASAHARRYQCARCAHRAQTANQARDHERWHRGHKYECKQCGITFDKPTSHLTHIRKAHRSMFACEACGESCVSAHGLRMHRAKTRHTDLVEQVNEPPSERYCSECKVQFLSRAAWRRHALTAVHHRLQHTTAKKCIVCGAEFATSTELLAHVRAHRRALRPAPPPPPAPPAQPPPAQRPRAGCELCSATFVNKCKLQAHVRRAHLGLAPRRDFVCEVCGKHFKSNATLKYHHRTHSGERPHPCAACPKRFADSNQLRIHQRTHSGARPYACPLCARSFRQKPALNRHMRVHTGAKPYACTFCPKAFSQSNSLKLHARAVHLKLPSNRRRVAKGSQETSVKEIG